MFHLIYIMWSRLYGLSWGHNLTFLQRRRISKVLCSLCYHATCHVSHFVETLYARLAIRTVSNGNAKCHSKSVPSLLHILSQCNILQCMNWMWLWRWFVQHFHMCCCALQVSQLYPRNCSLDSCRICWHLLMPGPTFNSISLRGSKFAQPKAVGRIISLERPCQDVPKHC